ncbi:uncharacterized TPR repeat-containing protein-like protein, partial [Tanacetum coccineum]
MIAPIPQPSLVLYNADARYDASTSSWNLSKRNKSNAYIELFSCCRTFGKSESLSKSGGFDWLKVRITFERFDFNEDRGLDKEELGCLLISRNPNDKAREELGSYVDKVFRWYAKYIDGDKGLTCDELLRTYDHGINSLDIDFETLGLELRSLIETQNASRKRD